MTGIPEFLPPDRLAVQSADRIAGHLRRMRTSWPGILANQRQLASQRPDNGSAAWPGWCWLPMASTAAVLQGSGRAWLPTDVAYAAAVGQWRLTGRHIVIPSPDVTATAVPGSAGGDPGLMDLRLPREQLLDDLSGHCYYLVMPRPADGQPGAPGEDSPHGCYAHLEFDSRAGQGAELRLLIDHPAGLVPVPVLLTQPTLAWSAARITGEGTGGAMDEAAGMLTRLMAWWVWPVIGALLDRQTVLTKTMVLDGQGTPAGVRGSQVWEITYTRPAPQLRLAGAQEP